MFNDRAKAQIIEAANEIINARTDDEMAEAARAMAAILKHFKISAE